MLEKPIVMADRASQRPKRFSTRSLHEFQPSEPAILKDRVGDVTDLSYEAIRPRLKAQQSGILFNDGLNLPQGRRANVILHAAEK